MKKNIILLSAVLLAAAMAFSGCGSKTADEETNSTKKSVTTEATTLDAVSTTEAESETDTKAEGETEGETKAPADDKTAASDLIQLQGPQQGDTIAIMHTDKGDIKLRLFPQYAPKAVENFTTHAKEGYYDGVIFHRVIKDFMIQGGDPEGTGRGGESIWGGVFENEVTFDLRNFRGALCMANAGPNTNGSQFYIVQNHDIGDDGKAAYEEIRSMQDEEMEDGTKYGDIYPDAVIDEYINNGGAPWLDGSYTVFGQVYEGMDVVDAIADVETDNNDKPMEDVVIKNIEISTYGA